MSTPQNISVLSTPEDIWGGPFTFSTWCEDIHRVNLLLYACGAMQLPPYQLLGSLEEFWKVPDGMLPDEGVAPGALGRTPPRTPT